MASYGFAISRPSAGSPPIAVARLLEVWPLILLDDDGRRSLR
jgi:hypothetical protein